jgi:hypothetical protein
MGTDTQKHATIHRAGLRRRPIGLFGGAALAVAGTAALIINLGAPAAFAAEAPVGLGAVASYSVLGGETVTNTGLTVLDGDLGTTPGSAITGFAPGIVGGTTPKHPCSSPMTTPGAGPPPRASRATSSARPSSAASTPPRGPSRSRAP